MANFVWNINILRKYNFIFIKIFTNNKKVDKY